MGIRVGGVRGGRLVWKIRSGTRVSGMRASCARLARGTSHQQVARPQLHSDLRTPCHPARSATKMLPKSCSVACGVVSRLRYYHDAGGLYSASPRGIWNPILFAGIVLFGRCSLLSKCWDPAKYVVAFRLHLHYCCSRVTKRKVHCSMNRPARTAAAALALVRIHCRRCHRAYNRPATEAT